MKKLIKPLLLSGLLIILISNGKAQNTLISEMDNIEWEQVMPGIWKATIGEMGLNPLDYANPPKSETIKEIGNRQFPFSKNSTYS